MFFNIVGLVLLISGCQDFNEGTKKSDGFKLFIGLVQLAAVPFAFIYQMRVF